MPARRSVRSSVTPHRRQRSTVEKGYGAEHRRLRREAKKQVDAGAAACWRCGRLIHPAEPWDLGHDDPRLAKHPALYRGPEHRSCSPVAGGLEEAVAHRDTGTTPHPAVGEGAELLRHEIRCGTVGFGCSE